VVLLSHDHHFDNLDHLGRAALTKAQKVLTTEAGASRLGGNAAGMAPWSTVNLTSRDGRVLTVTGAPARQSGKHGSRSRRWLYPAKCGVPGFRYLRLR
jgi:hypothetical protein